MSWESDHELVMLFLSDQMNELDNKIARLNSALESCAECLEADGLRASLHNAELEHDVLHELLMKQLDSNALSLDVLIMQRMEQFRREANRLAQNWHRGQQTPPAYWDAEVKQSFLRELMNRYHACQDGRPYHVPAAQQPETPTDTTEPEETFPWFTQSDSASAAPEDNTLRETVFSALRRSGESFDHLEVIVQPGGQVIVTGYAHTDHDRERILGLITGIDGVRQVMSDLKIVDTVNCPACEARNGARPPASS